MAKRRPSGDGMVRKREDGRWEGRIVVGHKKNGTPIFQHAYAHTQKELTEKLHQNIERYQDVELTEDSRMTLGEWLDRWLTDYKENTVRPGTLAGYRSCIENYIKPQLGGKQVSLVTSRDVQKLYRRLKENGLFLWQKLMWRFVLSDMISTRPLFRCLWRTLKKRVSLPMFGQRFGMSASFRRRDPSDALSAIRLMERGCWTCGRQKSSTRSWENGLNAEKAGAIASLRRMRSLRTCSAERRTNAGNFITA